MDLLSDVFALSFGAATFLDYSFLAETDLLCFLSLDFFTEDLLTDFLTELFEADFFVVFSTDFLPAFLDSFGLSAFFSVAIIDE